MRRCCGFVSFEQLNARVHMHVCETSDEDADSVGSYGLRTLQRLEGLGLLNDRLIGAHMVHLTDDDIVAVRQAGFVGRALPRVQSQAREWLLPSG